jgi:hypothetical protein
MAKLVRHLEVFYLSQGARQQALANRDAVRVRLGLRQASLLLRLSS